MRSDRMNLKQWMAGAVSLAALFCSSGAMASDAALMPWPQEVEFSGSATEAVPLAGPFQVVFVDGEDARLQRAIGRFQADVTALTGVSGAVQGPRLSIATRKDPDLGTVTAKEGYRLTVDPNGVTLVAEGPDGVLRGLATLRQLIEARGDGFVLPFARIEDAPRFAWRGLMIDTARHFMTLPTLKRQIDAMERTKLNVLHLHFSDNEGFRIQSLRYPRLTEVVGGRQYYTQDEVRDLIAYAADRGIRVVPEIDVPGHVGAILAAYPELSSGPVDPASRIKLMGLALDPTKPETYAFIQGLFEEMSGLFPDAYFHVGGDEVPGAAWESNPAIKAYMVERGHADAVALQDEFFQRVKTIVDGLGRITMGWEEIAHREIADDVLVQAWRSSEATGHITAQGNPAVVSAGYYLDLLWSGDDKYSRDPLDLAATEPDSPEKVLGPRPVEPMSAGQARLVLGAEAALWSEAITDEMLDGRLWPRAALLAERFWSPAEVRDPVDAVRRAAGVQEGLRVQGLADEASRHRMSARLSPQDAEAVETLMAVTAPVRNMGRLFDVFAAVRTGQPIRLPAFNAPVDIAGPDSVEVYRMRAWADAFARGDVANAGSLQAALSLYRDNHPRFVAAARGVESLEAAIPVSEDVAHLATVGLEAMEMKSQNRRPTAQWRAAAQALLDEQAAARDASSSVYKIIGGVPQPPALLLIGLTPVVERLVQATEQ